MTPIAVVGMGCRFPGAADLDAYWRLLREGVDAIREVPPDRWDLGRFYDPVGAEPGKMTTRWGGFLDRVDGFDPSFFGISPREAAYMDPQQRLLLEVAWEALEDAGVVLERWAGRPAGVFVGISTWDYGARQLTAADRIVDGYANTGSALSIAANRISYLFDLRGPSVAVDTACSSSLTAVHLACQSLLSGESAMALAGGVNVILSPATAIGFSKLKAMAADGRCKSFDARADGYVRAEGAGVVVLKPLADALRDGDRVHAVIRGSAVNQDGRTNGLTAPNGLSQEALIRHALERAGVEPRDIGYVEAHGTGTPLGDPIELNALGAALAAGRPAGSRCFVGSVKSNMGHLEAAAGVAGLIKTALVLEHGEIPPSLHFEKPNPHIPFDTLPLEVARALTPWPAERRPALAGVSSFGFGGTNVHVVLEEPPRPAAAPAEAAPEPDRAWLVPLSARSPEALRSLARAWCERLGAPGDAPAMRDLVHTAARRRTHQDHRLGVVARTRADLREQLAAHLAGEAVPGLATGRIARGRRRKLAFVFPGQGSQWFGMARLLAQREKAFADALRRCEDAIRREVGWSLLEALHADAERSRLAEVDVIQPSLWAIQAALAALWRSWGVTPDAVVGHSMGEVAAAHVAGALSLDDAARVICRRSRLLRSRSGRGAMAAVELSIDAAREALAGYEDRVSIAVSNSPSSTVLSGDVAALEEILRALEARAVFCRRVKVDVASHSPQMDPLRPELLAALEGLAPTPPALPLYSTVTAGTGGLPALDATYWVRNLREPVLFSRAVERLVQDGHSVFLELSPHPILLAGVQQTLQHLGKEGAVLPSLRREEDEQAVMLGSLGALFTLGRPVDWNAVSPPGRLAALPAYPWQRERCWTEDPPPERTPPRAPGGHPLLGTHFQSAADGTHFWDGELAPGAPSFLSDHRVQGVCLLPAAAYLEMALVAAREALGPGPHAVEGMEFQKALVLPDAEPAAVQVVLTPGREGEARFQLFSRAKGGAGEEKAASLHATARVRAAPAAAAGPEEARSLDDIRAACTDVVGAVHHYRETAENGLDFGPAFQVVERIWRRDGEALGRIHLPHALAEEARAYVVHPALLDGCFQVLAGALGHAARRRPKGEAWLAVGLDELTLHAPIDAGAGYWGHARVADAPEADADGVRGHVLLLDQAGRVALRARGLRLRRLALGVDAAAREGAVSVAAGPEDAAPQALTPAAILSAPAGERQQVLERHLQRRVAGVLRLPAAKLDVHRPLSTMGIDSLMAVELKNGVESELKVSVPLIQLIQGPTVAELAAMLLEQLAGNGAPPAARPQPVEPSARDTSGSQLLSLLSLAKDEREA